MRKTVPISLIVAISVTPLALAQTPSNTKDHQARPPAKKNAVESKPDLRPLLRHRVDQVDWDDTPFDEVIEWLRDQGQINVVVRWSQLNEVGVFEDSPVTLRLKNTTVAAVLSESLTQVSDQAQLRYIAIGLTLTISTRQDLNSKLYVRTYSVNDLLFRIPDFTDAPQVNLQQGGGGGGTSGSAQQNPFQGGSGGGGGDSDNRSKAERLQDLVELIKLVVEPESWRDAGGEGTIRGFNGEVVVVRACLEVHHKLGGPLILE